MINYCEKYWEDVDAVIDCIPNVSRLFGKSILITGATGMICSCVVEILVRLNRKFGGNIAIILAGRNRERMQKRFYTLAEGEDYTFVFYDATRKQSLDVRADYIIHGASNANPAIYTKEPVETMLANIVGLNDLLSLAASIGTSRLLYISSSEVYGNIDEVRAYRETDYGYVDILKSRACYPSAKRAAETLCVAYGEEYGLDTVIVRPGHIYGPSISASDSRASAQFTRNAAARENILMKSAGTQLRSYCYSLDCASAILAVLVNGQKGNAYNISNRDSIATISDIAKALADACGTQVTFENASEQEKKGFNLMSNSSLNAEKLEQLGWKAVFDLNQGARKTIQFYTMRK